MSTPALAHNVRGRGRHYTHPVDGQDVPSITNVIGVLSKDALPRWAAKMVAEQAWKMRHSLDGLGEDEAVDVLKGSPWRNSGRAANRGTSVHDYLEAAANGDPLPTLEGDAARYQKAADEFLSKWEPTFHRTECTVFGDGYAGTADFIATIGGRFLLGDYKTSKALYPEIALQLAAIRYADSMVAVDGDIELTPIYDGCVGVLLTPDGVQVREIDAGPDAYKAFMACLEAWRWRKGPNPVGKEEVA